MRFYKYFFNYFYKRKNIYVRLNYIKYRLFLLMLKFFKHDTLIKIHLKELDKNLYMYVDLMDKGISKDLLLYRTREENATNTFKSYLKPDQVIIDIGANIGYYVLIEALKVRPLGKIFAIEPAPDNVRILKKNIELNKCDDIVFITPIAISNKIGFSKLYLADRSNLHTLTKVPEMDKYVKFKTDMYVPTFSLDEFIKQVGICPEDIDIIRMDIEGHEIYALEGMKWLLENSSNLLLFIEVHPKLIKQIDINKYEEFLNNLKSYGFKIKDCFLSVSSREDKRINVYKWEDLLYFNDALELILIKE